MADPQHVHSDVHRPDERLAVVRQYVPAEPARPDGMRQLDLDRTDVAVVLWRARVSREHIALVCGIRVCDVPAVLAGRAVR